MKIPLKLIKTVQFRWKLVKAGETVYAEPMGSGYFFYSPNQENEHDYIGALLKDELQQLNSHVDEKDMMVLMLSS